MLSDEGPSSMTKRDFHGCVDVHDYAVAVMDDDTIIRTIEDGILFCRNFLIASHGPIFGSFAAAKRVES
jgi:hypothetical protein